MVLQVDMVVVVVDMVLQVDIDSGVDVVVVAVSSIVVRITVMQVAVIRVMVMIVVAVIEVPAYYSSARNDVSYGMVVTISYSNGGNKKVYLKTWGGHCLLICSLSS